MSDSFQNVVAIGHAGLPPCGPTDPRRFATYTTSQLLGMSAQRAKSIGVAFCTDCITTNGILTEVGGMVRWSGYGWVTFIDNVAPTTSFNEFCIHLFRRNFNSNTVPGTTRFAQIGGGNANSGTGAAISSTSSVTSNGQINQLIASTGTTAAGIGAFVYNGFDTDPTNWNSRAIGMVLNHVTVDQSVVGQTFSYRSGIRTYTSSSISALQSDEVCLVYDPNDTLGAGINTDNWWYLVRANGTTLFTGDTGIPRTTPLWACATTVPVSGTTVVAQVATALNNGSSYTVHVNQSVTFSASQTSATLCLAKAAGLTAKTATRQHNPKMFAARTNNLTPTAVVY